MSALAWRLAAEAMDGAERVVAAEVDGRVTYISGSTARKMSAADLLARQITLAIDDLGARRSLVRLYQAPACRHGVSLRSSFGCVECQA